MLLHIVLINFRDDVSEERKSEIYSELRGLVGTIDGLVSARFGPNVSPEGLSKGFRDGFVMELRDADAPNPVPVSAIFRDKLGGALENDRLQAAIGALLKQIAETDVDVLLDQRPLDVHLRESLRLAADWARQHPAGKIPASAATH